MLLAFECRGELILYIYIYIYTDTNFQPSNLDFTTNQLCLNERSSRQLKEFPLVCVFRKTDAKAHNLGLWAGHTCMAGCQGKVGEC